jgi:hypothetical protein
MCAQQPEPHGVPACPIADGTTIRSTSDSDGKIYVVAGGAKFWIVHGEDLDALYGGVGRVADLSAAALGACGTVPAAGTNVQEASNPNIGRIGSDGLFHHIVHAEDLQNNCGGLASVVKLPDGALAENGIGTGIDI